jgi:hypothetical protein
VTIDWSTVTAVSGSAVTLPSGQVVAVGQKYLRYGTVLTKITASGLFGAYASGASDGRQTLTPGACFILDQTVVMDEGTATDPPAVFDGGRYWPDRVTDIAANPAIAAIRTAFPGLTEVRD